MSILKPHRNTMQIGLEIVQNLIKFKQDSSIPNLILGLLDMIQEQMGKEEAVKIAEQQLSQMADFIDVHKLASLLYDQDKTLLLMTNQLPESLDEEQSIKNYYGQAQELINQLHANPDYDLALHTKFLGLMEKSFYLLAGCYRDRVEGLGFLYQRKISWAEHMPRQLCTGFETYMSRAK